MTKSIYDVFETDSETETKGINYNMGKMGKFVLARAGGDNEKYSSLMEKVFRPYRKQIERGRIDADLMITLLVDVFAGSVILGWSGVTDRKGKEIKYSVAKCRELMTELPELFTELRDAASDIANYRAEQVETDTKN